MAMKDNILCPIKMKKVESAISRDAKGFPNFTGSFYMEKESCEDFLGKISFVWWIFSILGNPSASLVISNDLQIRSGIFKSSISARGFSGLGCKKPFVIT